MEIKRFVSQIRGLQVVGAKGAVFGEVEDLEISIKKVTALVVCVKASHVKELGLKKPFWSKVQVLIPAKHISAITEVVVLKISLEEFAKHLAELPERIEKSSREQETYASSAKNVPMQDMSTMDKVEKKLEDLHQTA